MNAQKWFGFTSSKPVNVKQNAKLAERSLRDVITDDCARSSRSTNFYDNDQTEEVCVAFIEAKRLLINSIQHVSYQLFLQAIDIFQKLAYIPNVRRYYINVVVLNANLPLLSQLVDDMLASPTLFANSIKLSEYHFERYVTKAKLILDEDTKNFIQANDADNLNIKYFNLESVNV